MSRHRPHHHAPTLLPMTDGSRGRRRGAPAGARRYVDAWGFDPTADDHTYVPGGVQRWLKFDAAGEPSFVPVRAQ